MDILISIVLDLLHIIKFFIIGDFFLVFAKKDNRYGKGIVYIATAVLSALLKLGVSNLTDSSTFNLTIQVFWVLLFTWGTYMFVYEEKKGTLLAVSAWSNVIISIIDRISNVVATTILTILSINSIYLEKFFFELLTLAFLGVTGVLLRRKYAIGIRNIGIGYYIGFTFLAFADLGVLTYLGDFTINKVVVGRKIVFEIIFLVVCFGILFQMAMVIFLIMSRNVFREKEQLASQYLNEQQKHYEYLEMRERKTKKFRHDLRNHMYMLNTLNQQQEYEKLQEYLKIINGEIEAFGNSICVNNGIVDAILNKFASEAEKLGMKMEVIGHFPSKCNIGAYDLCTIFSNLLNNAVEAEQESEGDTIHVSCGYTQEKIIISIENDSVGKKIEKNGTFETSKKDKFNHGFGLENVKECVERNEGELLIKSEENRFKVIVLLNNEAEE